MGNQMLFHLIYSIWLSLCQNSKYQPLKKLESPVHFDFRCNRGRWCASSLSRGWIQKIFISNFYQCMGPIYSLYWRSTNGTSVSWTGELSSAMTRGPDDPCAMISTRHSAPCFRNALSRCARGFVSTSELERLHVCAFHTMFCIVKSSLYVGFYTRWIAIKSWNSGTFSWTAWNPEERWRK
jgi:hypothetical protein